MTLAVAPAPATPKAPRPLGGPNEWVKQPLVQVDGAQHSTSWLGKPKVRDEWSAVGVAGLSQTSREHWQEGTTVGRYNTPWGEFLGSTGVDYISDNQRVRESGYYSVGSHDLVEKINPAQVYGRPQNEATATQLFGKVQGGFDDAIKAAAREIEFNRVDTSANFGGHDSNYNASIGVLQAGDGPYYITHLEKGEQTYPDFRVTPWPGSGERVDLQPLTSDLKAIVTKSELFNFTDQPATFVPMQGG